MSGETKGKWRKSPARFSKEAFPWTTSFRNIPVLAAKGKKIQTRVVYAHFGLLLSSSSTKVKMSERTSMAGKMAFRKTKRRALPLLTTFLSFWFSFSRLKSPRFWSLNLVITLERRRRRLQHAEEPQPGILSSLTVCWWLVSWNPESSVALSLWERIYCSTSRLPYTYCQQISNNILRLRDGPGFLCG